tara:strand:+ start:267 stop:563 length:297 start_codon:yes stop_codon:yes gene_type:complete
MLCTLIILYSSIAKSETIFCSNNGGDNLWAHTVSGTITYSPAIGLGWELDFTVEKRAKDYFFSGNNMRVAVIQSETMRYAVITNTAKAKLSRLRCQRP